MELNMIQVLVMVLGAAIGVRWLISFSVRHRKQAAQVAEEKKYALWDVAYNKALAEGKSEYHSVCDAVKSIDAPKAVLKIWDDTYNQALSAGIREYAARSKAAKAVRETAHQ